MRLRPVTVRWLMVVASATVLLAGCSDDSSTATTTTTAPTTTAPPTSSTTPPGDDGPLPVAWVRQVGGPGEETVTGVAGRDDVVLGIGTTTGVVPDPPRPGTRSATFVDVVAAADGVPKSTTRSDQARTTDGRAIASGTVGTTQPTPDSQGGGGGQVSRVSMACGSTPSSERPDPAVVAPAGGSDGWCAPVGEDGTLGPAQLIGSDADDAVAGVTVHSDLGDSAGAGTPDPSAFAVGRTSGLFPGAKDPTGGYLGEGDALVLRLDPTGSVRWARQFGTVATDEADAVTTSDDGDVIVGGSTDGRTDGDLVGTLGARDAWMARIDPSGNLRWLTQFGSPGADRVRAVGRGGDPLRGTELFVGGGSTGGSIGSTTSLGGLDAMTAAFDASGRLVWSGQFGSPRDDEVTGVVVDGSTVYVSGTTDGEIVGAERISLTPTDEPDPGEGPTTAPSTTAPPTTAPPTGGGRDSFLAAIDAASGEVRWVAQFGTAGEEQTTAMTRTESGLLVVSGSTTGQLGATPPGGGTDGFMIAFRLPATGGGAASIV